VVRDPEYLSWLHTQPCIVTGRRGVQAHHVDRPRNDRRSVPVIPEMHVHTPFSVHGGGGRRRFEERWSVDFEAEIRRLNQKYESEVLGRVA
jgi:hypothetical protein